MYTEALNTYSVSIRCNVQGVKIKLTFIYKKIFISSPISIITEFIGPYLKVITKNRMFNNAGKLKVNMGNIHFKTGQYNKAIKYYRMALDQVIKNIFISIKIFMWL